MNLCHLHHLRRQVSNNKYYDGRLQGNSQAPTKYMI